MEESPVGGPPTRRCTPHWLAGLAACLASPKQVLGNFLGSRGVIVIIGRRLGALQRPASDLFF
eukprot:2290150-Alexandrium_andersonii.AAC.1